VGEKDPQESRWLSVLADESQPCVGHSIEGTIVMKESTTKDGKKKKKKAHSLGASGGS
jgi:hypothetical protein